MSNELDYIADLERENRLLGERCNQLLKDKGELTDKIADIKANCDLAIEGRDIKIKELEKENKRLKGDLELYESGGCRATNLFECGVVKELKEQLTKATELLRKLVLEVTGYEEIYGYDTCEPVQEAEQFLRETDIDNAIQKANEGLDLDKIAEEVEQDIKEQKVK